MCVEQFIGLSEIELKDSIKMPGDLCIMIFHDAYTFHSGFYNYNMISDNQDILYVTYDIINDTLYLGIDQVYSNDAYESNDMLHMLNRSCDKDYIGVVSYGP